MPSRSINCACCATKAGAWSLPLQLRYRDETAISGLKVKHNNVLGYFVEVSHNHGDKLLGHDTFIHRQTLASAVRFGTVELGELEDKIAPRGRSRPRPRARAVR